MASIKGITIELGSTDKSVMKLRAIAKHAEALADELDDIDNKEPCKECGSFNYSVGELFADGELYSLYIECHDCGVRHYDKASAHEGDA